MKPRSRHHDEMGAYISSSVGVLRSLNSSTFSELIAIINFLTVHHGLLLL